MEFPKVSISGVVKVAVYMAIIVAALNMLPIPAAVKNLFKIQ